MIIIRQKEFNSKAQKARRRAYDLQQGSTAKNVYIRPPRGYIINSRELLTNVPSQEELLANAQLQDKMIGRKKTMDLIKKGEKSAANKVNKKELDEINRARNLLIAGRDRNRDRTFKNLYEGKKENLNDIINWRAARRTRGIDVSTIPPCVRKMAIEQSKIARHEAKAAELRAKKVAGQKLVKNLKTVGKVLH